MKLVYFVLLCIYFGIWTIIDLPAYLYRGIVYGYWGPARKQQEQDHAASSRFQTR